MRKPFEVGQRVRTYALQIGIHDGTVDEISDGNKIWVLLDNSNGKRVLFYPQQIRRLIKKPRRRVWCRLNHDGSVYDSGVHSTDPGHPWIEFIEVRKPK